MAEPLGPDEKILAEIYAVKLMVIYLTKLILDVSADREAQAVVMLQVISASIEAFTLHGAPEERTLRVREAMQERVQQAVSTALNPRSQDHP